MARMGQKWEMTAHPNAMKRGQASGRFFPQGLKPGIMSPFTAWLKPRPSTVLPGGHLKR